MSTWSTRSCMDRLRAAPVQSWKEIHSRLRVMAARSRKFFCSVPSRAPPARDWDISVKLLSMTGESRENRKPVEDSAGPLERSTEVNWCKLLTGSFCEKPEQASENFTCFCQDHWFTYTKALRNNRPCNFEESSCCRY